LEEETIQNYPPYKNQRTNSRCVVPDLRFTMAVTLAVAGVDVLTDALVATSTGVSTTAHVVVDAGGTADAFINL